MPRYSVNVPSGIPGLPDLEHPVPEGIRHGVYMLTLTVPHDAGMPLDMLWSVIGRALQGVRSGRAYQELKGRAGIVATATAKELTHGPNGWHPHIHILLFTTYGGDPGQFFGLLSYFREAWRREVTRAGLGEPDRLHGVRLDECYSGADAGLYLAKVQDGRSVGSEVARGDLKSAGDGTIDGGSLRAFHRTPFEILADFERLALVEDRDLWAEYERVMHGKQALVWSRGYRQILGMDPEQSDEEVAASEVGGQPVAVLTAQTWAGVVVARKVNVPWSDARLYPVTALLEGAEVGGLPAVNEVLAGLSLPLALSPLVAGHQDLAGEAWAGWRATTCVRCGVAPRGPGGIICAGCRAAIERGRQDVIIVKELPRCPVRACPARYPGGEDRLCHDHALEAAGDAFTRMSELTGQAPVGHAVREQQVVLPLLAGLEGSGSRSQPEDPPATAAIP